MVNATFQVADAILLVAALSFLGLGIPPPAANWGGMLSNGLNYTYSGYWWLVYPAGDGDRADGHLLQLHRRRAARRVRGQAAPPMSAIGSEPVLDVARPAGRDRAAALDGPRGRRRQLLDGSR